MRFILCAFMIWTLGISAQNLPVQWTGTYEFTVSNAIGGMTPRVVLNGSGNPVLYWIRTQNGTGFAVATVWDDTGFVAPQQISPAGLPVYGSLNEGGDIASSGDTIIAAFFTNSSKVYSLSSFDGGLTWGDTVRVDTSVHHMAYTPALKISGGIAYLVYETSDMMFQNAKHVMVKSTDGGLSWSLPVLTHDTVPGVACECCPGDIAVKDSLVAVLYRNNESNIRDIYAGVSRDQGTDFNEGIRMDSSYWMITSCPVSAPAGAFAGDSLFAVWKSGNRVYWNGWNTATGQTAEQRMIDASLPGSIIQRTPAISVSGDTVALVWEDQRTGTRKVYLQLFHQQGYDASCITTEGSDTSAAGMSCITPDVIYQDQVIHLVYRNNSQNRIIYRRGVTGTLMNIPSTEAVMAPLLTVQNDELLLQGANGLFRGKIIGLSGSTVSVFEGNRVSLSGLPAGVYICQYTDGKQVFNSKFIIAR